MRLEMSVSSENGPKWSTRCNGVSFNSILNMVLSARKTWSQIADEHQADQKKKDYGLSLYETVVVLSDWFAAKYKSFFSRRGIHASVDLLF